MTSPFHNRAVAAIRRIPRGRVATYGQIARLAGNPRAARQVARTLHSSAGKERLPWHRVINKEGRISLVPGRGYEYQRALLEDEGVVFGAGDVVDLKRYQWRPRTPVI